MNKRTRKEIKQILYECVLKGNNIFTIEHICKQTGLYRKTVLFHLPDIMKEIRFNNNLVKTIKEKI